MTCIVTTDEHTGAQSTPIMAKTRAQDVQRMAVAGGFGVVGGDGDP